MTTKQVVLSIGGTAVLIAPGAEVEYAVIAPYDFRLRGLRAVVTTSDGNRPGAHWPIVACHVGDRRIDNAGLLYDDVTPTVLVPHGCAVHLRLCNTLGVSASWSGALTGVAYARDVNGPRSLHRPRLDHDADPPRLGEADLVRMVRQAAGADDPVTCHACGEDLKGAATRCWDGGRVYCKPCYDRRELGRRLTTPSTARLDDEWRCAGCKRDLRLTAYRHWDPVDGRGYCNACRQALKVSLREHHCCICGACDAPPASTTGWVYGAGAEAFCSVCVAARGGVDAFMRYRAEHGGLVPPFVAMAPSPLVSRAAAGLPDPATVPAKRGVEAVLRCNPYHGTDDLKPCPRCGELRCPRCRDARGYCKLCDTTTLDAVVCAPENHRPAPRTIYYCEAAPPREVVAAATCLLDGDECGAPALHPHVVVPLVFTARMKIEWERHDAFAERERGRRGIPWFDAAARPDRDMKGPEGTDAYGGAVCYREPYAMRCALCGAWLRAVTP